MKLSFSTLGCPGWSFNEFTSAASDLGYDGVEIRGIGKYINATDANEFQPDAIDNTLVKLDHMKLNISCLTTGVRLNEQFKIAEHMESGKAHIDLAVKLNVKHIRILADTAPEPTSIINLPAVIKSLKELCDYADGKGVTILVETNGYFSKSENMLALINGVDSENLAVLWDIHHPYRFANEEIAYTYSKLKPYIQYIHLKDSIMNSEGVVEYQMMGYGDIPIEEAVQLLKDDNFDGYLSLEWLKRWCHNLVEAGIIFPQYINYMKNIID